MLCELVNLQDAEWLKGPMQLRLPVHDLLILEPTSRIVQAKCY